MTHRTKRARPIRGPAKWRARAAFFAGTLVIAAGVDLAATAVSPDKTAHAIVGRPLTPLSYAGVARRTVRRSAYVTTAAAATYAAPALPAGCSAVSAPGTVRYGCSGGAYYEPRFSGPNVVYVPAY